MLLVLSFSVSSLSAADLQYRDLLQLASAIRTGYDILLLLRVEMGKERIIQEPPTYKMLLLLHLCLCNM